MIVRILAGVFFLISFLVISVSAILFYFVFFANAPSMGAGTHCLGTAFVSHSSAPVSPPDISALEILAENGDAKAQHDLGDLYRMGKGVEKNLSIAASWISKAAEKGNIRAQSNLGEYYEKGIGVKKDWAQAERWYLKAAEQGDHLSQESLVMLYSHKNPGWNPNYVEAEKWERKMAEGGDEQAQGALGKMYEDGLGFEKNNSEAYFWYTINANNGGFDGLLPQEAEEGWNSINKLVTAEEKSAADRRIVQWYLKAAGTGDVQSQHMLGIYYSLGKGIKQDWVEAYFWHSLAANVAAKDCLFYDSDEADGAKMALEFKTKG